MAGTGDLGLRLGSCPSEAHSPWGRHTAAFHFMLPWFKLCWVNKAFLEEAAPERSLRDESGCPGWRLRGSGEQQGESCSQRDPHEQRSGHMQ